MRTAAAAAAAGGIQAVENRNLFQTVLDRIRDAVCDGTLKPNERLTQESIAERLNVSRQPVNQALLLLKSQGLVVDAGRRGVRVAPLDPTVVRDIYEIRNALDTVAVHRAASRGLSREDVQRGRTLLEHARRLLENGGAPRELIRVDMAFHRFLYELSGNSLLPGLFELHSDHLRRVMTAVLQAGPSYEHFWREHSAIFDALVLGDGARASELVRQHADNASRLLRAALLDSHRQSAGHAPMHRAGKSARRKHVIRKGG